MKLVINLDDRADIVSGLRLLSNLLEETPASEGTQAAGLATLLVPTAPTATIALQSAAPTDAAAVFGGVAAAPAPLAPSIPPAPAPSIAAPAPLIPPAPITTTHGAASSVAVASSVELDRDGLPWDARIHAESKAKIADGTWRKKRGVDPALVVSVEAQLRGVAAPLASAPVAATVAAHVPPPPSSGPASSAPVAPPVASPDPTTFDQLMPRITAAVTSGAISIVAAQNACTENGIASIVALQQSPEFVPLVWATLKAQNPAVV